MTTHDQSTPKLINTTDSPQPPQKRNLFSYIGGALKYATIIILIALVVSGGFLIGGFLKFADTVTSYSNAQNPIPKSAAIVVFTGGTSRISEAVKLLKNGTFRS